MNEYNTILQNKELADKLQVLIRSVLDNPRAQAMYEFGLQLRALFPQSYVIERDGIEPINFINASQGKVSACSVPYTQQSIYCDTTSRTVGYSEETGVLQFTWNNHDFLFVRLQIPSNCDQRDWIIGKDKEAVEQFFIELSVWGLAVHTEIWLFEEGYWQKSEELYHAIRNSNLDTLVLPDKLKKELVDDATKFLESEDLYAKYNVPWKRGVLLLGPPGNGKTHAIKGLVNRLDVTTLYVKSFIVDESRPYRGVRDVFSHARTVAPCVLVLEDLDSLVDDHNRSFFLNEMDGFADNHGVFVIATTNHPEKLDSAILDRPSRFDRKYHFSLPDRGLRRRYLENWATKLHEEMALSQSEIDQLAKATEGFSFAYLKELGLSSVVAWFDSREKKSAMYEVCKAQLAWLNDQRQSTTSALPSKNKRKRKSSA